jgi:HSP20 family molecular chaperone IbpA
MIVPPGVEAADIEAEVSDGVLEISIPKPDGAERNGQTVEVKPKVKTD